MAYPLLLIFALLPSIIWLLFYLRKDVHPESNSMVLKIFFFGMLAAIPAIFLELGILAEIKDLSLSPLLISILSIFIGVALVEETLKYLVVRGKVLRSAEFDEPIDAMLYMIIAGLGFAASENILILFPLRTQFQFSEVFLFSAVRFLGATFLHALCSGLVGYFLALSLFEMKKGIKYLAGGLSLAILLHGLYNFSIMEMEGSLSIIIPLIILISLAVFLSLAFKRLKKLPSVCKIR